MRASCVNACRALRLLPLLLFCFAAHAEALKFSDIAGWWYAEPTFAGESSPVYLHFLEEGGKQSVRLSLVAIGGYDVPIGDVTMKDDGLDMQPYPFSLRYDSKAGTLSGHLPEAAVPMYRIPVQFKRSAPQPKPEPQPFNAPRASTRWTLDLRAPVWAGLAYDPRTELIFIGDDAGVLHAVDRNGKSRWALSTGKPIKGRPAVIGENVLVASDSGFLYKLEARTGAERWRTRIDRGSPERIPTNDPKTRWDRYGSSIVAGRGVLYVASRDKHVYAVDEKTGQVRWSVAAGDLMTATPAVYRDTVLIAAYDGKVQALSARDGAVRWTYDAKLPVAGDLVIDGDRVFIGSRSYDLIALDAASGKELWKHYYWFSWIESPPVVKDGVVYTGSSDAVAVYAINATNGSRRWRTHVPGWAWARTAVGDALVVAATVGQGKYPGPRAGALVAIDRASGAVRWAYLDPPSAETLEKKAEWGFGAAPLLIDGVVYAADLSGRLIALDAHRTERS